MLIPIWVLAIFYVDELDANKLNTVSLYYNANV